MPVGTNSTNPNFEPVPPAETDYGFWPFLIDLDVDEERGVPLVAAILRDLWNKVSGPWQRARSRRNSRGPAVTELAS